MGKRIVLALGGNALGNNLPEQMIAVKKTASAIVDLIEEGDDLVIAHGNGPQVGMIQKAMTELTRANPAKYITCPLSVCVAMSQGYIGYDLQNALREELLDRGIDIGCATVLTQVEVDPDDPAFKHPTKPIGAFMTKEEADKLVRERDYEVMEDAGKIGDTAARPWDVVLSEDVIAVINDNLPGLCMGEETPEDFESVVDEALQDNAR